MSAHPYWYTVKYQFEVDIALEERREREFRAGLYNPVMAFINFPITSNSLVPGPRHRTMHEAMEASDADGTRSILGAGTYVVEFASNKEIGDAFSAAKAGTTVTATVAGQVDQFLAIRNGKEVQQRDTPKVSVPLLVYPTLKFGDEATGKGKSNGKD